VDQTIGKGETGADGLADLARILDLTNLVVHRVYGAILHWTTGCERLYGWTKAEAAGRIVHDLLATKYPQPREAILAQLRDKGSWQGELEHRGKDGSAISIASLRTWRRARGRSSSPLADRRRLIHALRTRRCSKEKRAMGNLEDEDILEIWSSALPSLMARVGRSESCRACPRAPRVRPSSNPSFGVDECS
jgi:PAS domain S-box-containing protein